MDLIDGVGLRERAQRVELMAPAGSWEALTGALQGGADSVFRRGKAEDALRVRGEFFAGGYARGG